MSEILKLNRNSNVLLTSAVYDSLSDKEKILFHYLIANIKNAITTTLYGDKGLEETFTNMDERTRMLMCNLISIVMTDLLLESFGLSEKEE